MKKTILLFFLIVNIFAMGKAQEKKRTPEEKAKHESAMLQKKLKLDDAQKAKVYDIVLDRCNKIESLKAAAKTDANKQEIKAAFKDSHAKIVALLNDDQKKAFKELREERHEKKSTDIIQ